MPNKSRKILLLPGDGIGPEVIYEVRKILEWMNKTKSLDFVLNQELIGGETQIMRCYKEFMEHPGHHKKNLMNIYTV